MLFKDKYFFLSNFYECPIELTIGENKLKFKNAEAAYQAYLHPTVADKFCFLGGLEAKRMFTENKNDLYAMAEVLHAKFNNKYLLIMLKCVKDDIINDNFWKDTFWGVYKDKGRNILGKMLMNIRDTDNNYGALLAYVKMEITKNG